MGMAAVDRLVAGLRSGFGREAFADPRKSSVFAADCPAPRTGSDSGLTTDTAQRLALSSDFEHCIAASRN